MKSPTHPLWLRSAVRDGLVDPVNADALARRFTQYAPSGRRYSIGNLIGRAIAALIVAAIVLGILALIVHLWRVIFGA